MADKATTPEEEALLGHLLRQRAGGGSKSAYDVVAKAYAQLYPNGNFQGFQGKPDANAFGQIKPTGERSFTVAADEPGMKAEKLPTGVDRGDWYTGLLAHEMLGHGGDYARYPEMWSGGQQLAQGRHFMRSPYAGVKDDSIDWLISDTARRLRTPQEVSLQRQKDLQEAKARGLPTELPANTKSAYTRLLP